MSFTTYPSDTYLPNDGGKAKADYIICDAQSEETNYALYGNEYKLTAVTVNDNYIFSGWYDGDTKLTSELTYTFVMPAEDVTYTAKWIYYSITVEKNISEAGNITSLNDTPTKVGEETTITATTNNGYTWLGWYNGETKLTDELSYTFTMPAENVTYTAKWTFYTLTISANDDENESTARVQFNLNGASGTAPTTQIITKSNKLVYPAIPTRSGYVFAGWYNNSSCSGNAFDFSARVTGDTILYAKWVAYSGNGVIPYNSSITISVVSKSSSTVYYAFVPLVSGTVSVYSTGSLDTYGYLYSSTKSQLTTDDDSGDGSNFKITYSVTAGTLYYVRPCGYNSSGTTTVYVSGTAVSDSGTTGEANKGTIKVNGNNYSGSATKITAGQSVTITAITNSGYTWLGWYNGETELTKELSYTFTMPSENITYIAKWIACPVTLEQNDSEAGTISSLTGKYKVGDNVTVTATTNYGYTWLGWYNGETELTKELSYTFTMPSESVTYTAKWACYTLTTNTNIDYAGSYTNKNEVKTTAGQSVSLTASTNNGYTWLGWYNGDTLLSTELNYTFNMPSQSVTYTAKWTYYTVTTTRNDSAAGTINSFNNTKITVGNEVKLTAKTNNGYTWLGWFNGDQLVSKELNYTFEMPAENIEYTAKWITCPISIEKNINEAGQLGAIDKVTVVGNDITISAKGIFRRDNRKQGTGAERVGVQEKASR